MAVTNYYLKTGILIEHMGHLQILFNKYMQIYTDMTHAHVCRGV